jgi:hypothetical protein
MKISNFNLSARILGLQARLKKVQLNNTRRELKVVASALEGAQKKQQSLHAVSERMQYAGRIGANMIHTNEKLGQRIDRLKADVAQKTRDVKLQTTLSEKWQNIHSEKLDHIQGIKEAKRSEDLLDSAVSRNMERATLTDKSNTDSDVSEKHLPSELELVGQQIGEGGGTTIRQISVTTTEAERADNQNRSAQLQVSDDKNDKPVLAEVVAGRVFVQLQRHGSAVNITLLAKNVSDEQSLNQHRKKYEKLAQERGKLTKCSVRIERGTDKPC